MHLLSLHTFKMGETTFFYWTSYSGNILNWLLTWYNFVSHLLQLVEKTMEIFWSLSTGNVLIINIILNSIWNIKFNWNICFHILFIFRFQELRRDLQTVISTRTNFNIMHINDFHGETFLSDNVANSILKEFNLAIDRCSTVFINSSNTIILHFFIVCKYWFR